MKKSTTKVLNFMKKNAVYLILALCIVAVGLSVTLMFLKNNTVTPDLSAEAPIEDVDKSQVQEPEEPVIIPDVPDVPSEPVDTVITFILPVENATSIEDYSETMVFNSTLSRYESHMATDFYAEEGTNVLAVYSGTVENIESTLLTGITITIDHGNGLKTVYNSLADGDMVTVGQKVKQGDVIGQVSTTNRQEYKNGAHLHFEVIENGAVINPAKYLTIEEK